VKIYQVEYFNAGYDHCGCMFFARREEAEANARKWEADEDVEGHAEILNHTLGSGKTEILGFLNIHAVHADHCE